MPWNTTIPLARKVPKLVTEPGTAISTLSVQNRSPNELYVRPQVGETVPTAEAFMDGAYRLDPGEGFESGQLASLWPGLPGANRLFAMTEYRSAEITVSHA